MRIPVELKKSHRLLNHGPTTLITSAAARRRNVMAAAWVTPLDFEPAKISVVIERTTFTRGLIDESGELVVNLPTRALLEATYAAGQSSGRGCDKIAELGFRTAPATRVSAPLIEGCVAWLECRVIPEPQIQERYDLFIAEVLAAWADDEVFVSGAWAFPDEARTTVHHLSGGRFFLTGAQIQVDSPARER